MLNARWGLALVLAASAACGGGNSSDGDNADGDPADGDTDTTDDSPGIDAPTTIDAPAGFQPLLSGEWSLAAGEEAYFCVYATVPRDIYIKGFHPIAPPGTHHTVLTLYSGTGADGTRRCSVGTNGQSMIYGSGVGTPDFAFPEGVGLHLAAGQKLLLNLHLYNATDVPLTGTSGALFAEATAGEVTNLAELVLAGPTIGLTVPTGISTQTGNCHLSNVTNESIHVFALSQHMHKLGTHMKSTITRSGSPEIVLQDIDYNFEEQSFQLATPHIQLEPGDTLTTNCTYDNNTGAVVRFGESSDDEMCFSDIFYYPAQGADFICTN